jgi:two-component SAPR family response regulator
MEKSEREKALETTYKILRSDELWESGYRVQMRIFHEMGQLSQVRHIYFQCKHVFREKLGIDLSTATEELYQELLLG